MNYMQEELLRQQRAFRSLLLGGSEMAERLQEEDSDARKRGRESFLPEDLPVRRMIGQEAKSDAEGLQHQFGMTAELAGRKTADVLAERGLFEWRKEHVAADKAEMAGRVGRTTMTEYLLMSPTSVWDAERLSRLFQRDARRYDGGFSLY